jgi:hypothetical protein
MGRVRLPRRWRGARRVSFEHTTDSPPRHGTSRLPRLVVTFADRVPGASPVSSVLAGAAPVGGLRSSARPSRSSARLPRTSARLPTTSAQPPTSWERRPDGLGARNEEVGSRFQRRRWALHDVGTLREVLGACAEDLGPSPQVIGRLSEGSGRSFRGDRNDVLGPQDDVPDPRKGFPCPRLSFPCSRKDARGRRQRPTVPGGTFRGCERPGSPHIGLPLHP